MSLGLSTADESARSIEEMQMAGESAVDGANDGVAEATEGGGALVAADEEVSRLQARLEELREEGLRLRVQLAEAQERP